MNINKFISGNKTLLIAPAGYGKTHTIAQCILQTPKDEKQLILTHTHAGIASIREKLKKLNVPTRKYHIETITGFAQRYVLAFYVEKDIPLQENSQEYYQFIINKAKRLLKKESIKRTIRYSYQGLFVDEYQDCTKSQHEMLMVLSEILPIHILGDPMQGIFGFKEPLVDFEKDLNDFEKIEELDTPWRWHNSNKINLGNDLKDIRDRLQKGLPILLNSYKSFESVICNENDWYKPQTNYRDILNNLVSGTNLLLIHPISSSIEPRIKVLKSFNNRLLLLESIDEKEFYSLSSMIDNWDTEKNDVAGLIIKLSYKLFTKTGLNTWFNEKGLKKKTKRKEDIKKSAVIQELIISLGKVLSYSTLSLIIKEIYKLPGVKCYRKDLFFSLCQALNIAEIENKTVYEAMVSHKNIVRRVGRKIHGKCIGTTLLTKGLEFDTVVILNAHRIEDYKHFYVAITRACNKLIIFSEKKILEFN
jgi:DNA helicase-2/ATP-dependent DNA helicase PcrA